MLRSLNRIENIDRGARFLPTEPAKSNMTNIGNQTLVDRVRAIQGFENPPQQMYTGSEKISIRGPGRNSFICRNNFAVVCKNFENNATFRDNSTFEKTYPVCGTPGYFSLRMARAPALYLIAKDSKVIIGDISTLVNVQDSACWQTLPGPCTETSSIILANKSYPGLALTVKNENEIVMEAVGTDLSKFCLLEERGLNTTSMTPDPRPAQFSDYEIREGWTLADINRTFGPKEFRSYELEPTSARTVEECAAKASALKEANGFIFLPQGSYNGKNCKIKAGGFWPSQLSYDQNWRNLISGKLKVDINNAYRDPVSDFDMRRGWNVADMNITTGTNPSYTLEETNAGTPDACAAAALRNPRANSFVFMPGTTNPCKVKVGGYWPESQNPVHANYVGGVLKSNVSTYYDYRPGFLVRNDNRSYGSNPSYELKEVDAYSPDNCAEIALQDPRVNGFIYLPKRFSPDKGNCRQFIGGYWGPIENEGQRAFTAGIKKSQ